MMVCFFISVSMSTVGDNILNKPLPKVSTLHVLYINVEDYLAIIIGWVMENEICVIFA